MRQTNDSMYHKQNIPILVVDTGPLIQLVASGLIHDLMKGGASILLPDLIATEARLKDKPYADEVTEWIRAGDVQVSQTPTGDMFRAALIGDASFRAKDAIARAIIDWMLDTLDTLTVPSIVIYEHRNVPRLIRHYDSHAAVSLFTTHKLVSQPTRPIIPPRVIPNLHGNNLPSEVMRLLTQYCEGRETCSATAYAIHRLGRMKGHDFTGTACGDILIWCWQRRVFGSDRSRPPLYFPPHLSD